MVRRLASAVLLLTLVAVQAAPLGAGGTVCRMDRFAAAELCVSCDVAPAPSGAPTIRAGSCCRFETATPTSSLPGVMTSVSSAHQEARAAFATIPGTDHRVGASADHSPLVSNPAPRSTDSPVARNTNLRL